MQLPANDTWGVLMIEQNVVAAEHDAKSSRNDADLAGNSSAMLALVFCRREQRHVCV